MITEFANKTTIDGEEEDDDDDARSETRLVHYSMPMSCLMDSRYQAEFLARFRSGAVKHIIDCGETNPIQTNRLNSLTYTRQLSQISPSLIRAAAHPKRGANAYLRTELTETL